MDLWLETEPTVAIGWIDGDEIDTTIYDGTTGFPDADCIKVLGLQVGFLARFVLGLPTAPLESERRSYNAATLKCIGANPPAAIDPLGFDAEFRLLDYIAASTQYKLASASYQQVPVNFERPQPGLRRSLMSIAVGGVTEGHVAGTPFTIFSFASDMAPDNGTVTEADVSGQKTFYLLNKGRIGAAGQAFFCFINTGSELCDSSRFVPPIWAKHITAGDSPTLRLDLQRATTSFPTFRFYVPNPESRSDGRREFPLVQQDPLRLQAEPNSFIDSPQDSNNN